MKRTLEDREVDMANCLMLLSRVGESSSTDSESTHYSAPSRVFECKTCNRKFTSFQALGGHRASHKKPRLMDVGDFLRHETSSPPLPAKPKTHECSICGLEFAIGQALGGHMRRHRDMMSEGIVDAQPLKSVAPPPAVMKKSNSGKRVLLVDLNLTPLENLKFHQFLKLSPMVA